MVVTTPRGSKTYVSGYEGQTVLARIPTTDARDCPGLFQQARTDSISHGIHEWLAYSLNSRVVAITINNVTLI